MGKLRDCHHLYTVRHLLDKNQRWKNWKSIRISKILVMDCYKIINLDFRAEPAK